jgi:hypothetical protein
MWVCAQKDPANAATGNMATSSSTTDHTASRKTIHGSTGMYGFQGWVSTSAP